MTELKRERTLSERIARADAATECEKVMALHCYWHAGGIHREEIEQYWTKRHPLTWAHNFGQMKGVDNYTSCYADAQEANAEAYYKLLEPIYPEVKEVKEKRALIEEAMHLLVTPIIEVAGDGQTVKCLWYTPGCIFSSLTPRKEREGMWIWERYGADFVLEDGRWLFLNLKVCCDIAGMMDEPGWGLSEGPPGPPPDEDGAAEASELSQDAENNDAPRTQGEVSIPGPLHYNLSSTQLPQATPFIPVPYEIFSETYDYATLTGIYEEDAK
ncbi:MAG: nuclear transport factor 2 family protein [Clostridiales Family XIII bacterium]|jgi:hypothetical protein|nr:nuclear transport factor 2 family protein [Clostridiales Family XIII bacterium]